MDRCFVVIDHGILDVTFGNLLDDLFIADLSRQDVNMNRVSQFIAQFADPEVIRRILSYADRIIDELRDVFDQCPVDLVQRKLSPVFRFFLDQSLMRDQVGLRETDQFSPVCRNGEPQGNYVSFTAVEHRNHRIHVFRKDDFEIHFQAVSEPFE